MSLEALLLEQMPWRPIERVQQMSISQMIQTWQTKGGQAGGWGVDVDGVTHQNCFVNVTEVAVICRLYNDQVNSAT